MMVNNLYVKLDDVLALIPNNDIVGPKPSYLRKKINELIPIAITGDNEKDYTTLRHVFEGGPCLYLDQE